MTSTSKQSYAQLSDDESSKMETETGRQSSVNDNISIKNTAKPKGKGAATYRVVYECHRMGKRVSDPTSS